MIAVGLTFALFFFWLLLGLAVLTSLHTQRNLLLNVLIAPAVGFGIATLPIVWLNRAGLPVSSFAAPLLVALTVVSTVLLWRFRPRGSWQPYLLAARLYLMYAVALVVAFVLTGRPMFEFGLAWLSYGNTDMVNNVGEAQRYLNYGAFQPPNLSEVMDGKDYTQLYWTFTYGGLRLGIAPTLAVVTALTGHVGHEIYMPVTLAEHLALISAAAGMICYGTRRRLAAMLMIVMLSVSALTSLGTLYQLAPQVGGLALLCVAVTLLMTPWSRMSLRRTLRHGLLLGLVGASLLMVYPEVIPFLGLGYILFVLITVARRWSSVSLAAPATILASAGVAALVALNRYTLDAAAYIMMQVSYAQDVSGRGADAELFPYFRIPSGLANLWGFQQISSLPAEPWLSITIIAGACLLALVIAVSLTLTWKLQPVAILTFVMLLIGAQLFKQQSGFGLFKLAMFLQPFMLGTFIVGWMMVVRQRPLQVTPLVLFALLSVPCQYGYVQASRGVGSALNEVQGASSERINDQFQKVLSSISALPDRQLMVDTPSRVLAMSQAFYTRGVSTQFPGNNPFAGLELIKGSPFSDSRALATWNGLEAAINDRQIPAWVPWFPDDQVPAHGYVPGVSDPRVFSIDTRGDPSLSGVHCSYLIAMTDKQNLFNRWRLADKASQGLTVTPCGAVQNHVLFVNSPISHMNTFHTFGRSDARTVTLYQLENDPLFPNATFAGIGRRLLLQVLNPSPGGHLVLNLTSTLKGDGENQLPPAQLIASGQQTLPLVGRGSARVFSASLTTLEIAGRNFLGIDMGVDGVRFPDHRSGLMNLYGRDVVLDRRLLTAFARDVSFISDDELAHLTPPSVVQHFPDDLGDRNLEYSGVYEDGWISEASFFGLATPAERSDVVVKGVVPLIDNQQFQTELRILVDGQEVTHQTLGVGTFEIRAPAPPGHGRRRVELRFSELQHLPGADRRPAAARMESIGLVPSPATQTTPPAQSQPAVQPASQGGAPSSLRIPDELGKPELRTNGIAADGWVEASSAFELTQGSAPSQLVLSGVVPNVHDSAFSTTLTVLVDGQRVHEQRLGVGDFDLQAPVSAAAGQHHVELRFSATQPLPAPDGRPVGARLARIGFEPVAPAAVAPASAPSAPPTVAAAATPSAATPSAGTAPAPPQRLADLPVDLIEPEVRASGLDADGWAASAVSLDLSAPDRPSSIVVRGMVPLIGDPGFSTVARLLVDGREVISQTLSLGDFELRADAPPGAGKHTVEIRFSAVQALPAPDGRHVGARLQSIGFESASAVAQPSAAPTPAPSPEALPADLANPALNVAGLDTDGWLAGTASFDLASPASAASLVLRGMVPLVDDPSFSSELRVLVDGREAFKTTLGLGDFDLHVPLPSASGRRHVELQFSRTQLLPAPDTRRVGARIERAAIE